MKLIPSIDIKTTMKSKLDTKIHKYNKRILKSNKNSLDNKSSAFKSLSLIVRIVNNPAIRTTILENKIYFEYNKLPAQSI